MRVIVEEGLMPNGTDLVVMGEHNLNGVALANAKAKAPVRYIDIGDGYGVIGVSVDPVLGLDSDGSTDLCVILSVVGGKVSDLMPMQPVKLVLTELAKVPLPELRKKLEAALNPPETPA